MTEPTPPPERRLPDAARASIRAELLAHAEQNRSRTTQWAVPAGAAAAVALVAVMAFWAVSPGGEGDDARPAVSTEDASAPATPPATPSETRFPDGVASTTSAPEQTPRDPTDECTQDMKQVLRGAELAFQLDDATSFWVAGGEFTLCDQRAGTTTVHRPLPLEPADDVSTYAVSSVYGGPTTVIRVAGGVVPQGLGEVFDVAYTFDDGHTERATTATDDQGRTWWRMVYEYETDLTSELQQPPIQVTASYSGVQRSYTLEWGPPDTCAQANHGC